MIQKKSVINYYDGLLTVGVHPPDDILPRPCVLSHDEKCAILTGSYAGYYMVCRFPLKPNAYFPNVPHVDTVQWEPPKCEYNEFLCHFGLWTKSISYNVGIEVCSLITIEYLEELLQFTIPYNMGLVIQNIANGHYDKNGIMFL